MLIESYGVLKIDFTKFCCRLLECMGTSLCFSIIFMEQILNYQNVFKFWDT